MNFNELVFDVSFAVIPTVSICAYNQWNLNNASKANDAGVSLGRV